MERTSIGKTVAVIGDARLSGRADQKTVVERLLSVSGEDAITVDRKHIGSWTGRLAVRLMLLSNEVPALIDSSGAFASRFRVLRMVQSFFGREDPDLESKLLGDLPGIMHWAQAGLERVRARGRFLQPASGAETVRQLEALGSPIRAFIEERCELQPGASVECGILFGYRSPP